MRLPLCLEPGAEERALSLLKLYYSIEPSAARPNGARFAGSHFDSWDSTGTREADVDRFTADDLVATSILNANVPRDAAIALLDTRADEFGALLAALPDRHLVEEREPWSADWAGARLWDAVRSLPGMGTTVTSKLLARKRPLLHPITDTAVEEVTGATDLWAELRALLQDVPDLHDRLLSLRAEARLDEQVSPLRVFVVSAWMEAKGH